MAQQLAIAAELGLPGCIGWMDAVHVSWRKCPAGARHEHTGKEGYPTRAYNVVCDHNGLFYSWGEGWPGSYNDKSMVQSDTFVNLLRDKNSILGKQTFNLETLHGRVEAKGCYVGNDGGYHDILETMSANRLPSTVTQSYFTDVVDTERKLIECEVRAV